MSNNTTFAALKKNRSTQLSSLHSEIEKINNHSWVPRTWWLVHRKLFDYSWSERSPVRLQLYVVELRRGGKQGNRPQTEAEIDLHLKYSGCERPSQSSKRRTGSVVQVRKEDFRQSERFDESGV